ncbi:NAD(P)/FAD-dependent oxidoreductase [Piscinibacter koreensis]|uniref:NAD(P)/FAD-dependent oxidoreductase n=1 Tax=Piscinibacter koreensis TaxID=2742824 RepID=A0A7Y6NL11_9BURK|nr:NAD(P)/FAD-dependent oxidoreductase [Schlegelella koreensis]NUZ05112.1 NAD(P)/FAD-dependent oxidoreductase [Schlegelella koreensis]
MDRVDALVAGAGVVGLAIARALAERGLETIVVEREALIGSGVSSRNSEVIHAGLYNPPDWLKTRLCVAGREQLYAYCEAGGVGHARCGKLVVATLPEQVGALREIAARAAANGVEGLAWVDAAGLARLEPALHAVAALHSPVTGIVDSHALMLALLGDLERAGGSLALQTPVEAVARSADGFVVRTGGAQGFELATRVFVNAAGLGATELATRIEPRSASIPRLFLAKGNYFGLAGRAPFGRLVYPIPEPGGLGVHLTLDLAGQARFGPDVEWLTGDPAALDYAVDPARAAPFYRAIRAFWPDLPDGALQPSYSGVRPKLSGPGQPARDFMLQGPGEHGVAGLVNLFGIESPGLTACLAIADAVVERLGI